MVENFFIVVWIIVGILVFVITGPVVSLLWLLLFFCIGSIIMAILGMDYLAFLLIVVYAGAVVVLFLFITMFLNVRVYENFDYKFTYNWLSLFILFFVILFFSGFFFFNSGEFFSENIQISQDYISILDTSVHLLYSLGYLIFNVYFYIFFFLGLLLFIGMEGVLYLVLDFIKFLYIKVMWVSDI